MPEYLIDVNLPYYFALWNGHRFLHLKDIDETWPDSEVWNYAKNNNLIIITKDADFSSRIILSEPPPKVIHVKFGNMKMKDFHTFLNNIWRDVESMVKDHKLINVYVDRIEGVK